MSTIFLYPLEGHGQIITNSKKQEEVSSSSSDMTALTANGLSRILEIPLTLLDKTDSDEMSMKNTANQMFWIATNNTAKASAPSATNSTNTSAAVTNVNTALINNDNSNNVSTTTPIDVTHSFANRKRSIVKRRKSVLSAVFTAEEQEEEEEDEIIKNNREETLETLEKGTPNNLQQTISTKREERKKRRNRKITSVSKDAKEVEKEDYSHHQHHPAPKMDNIMMNDIANTTSPVSRGSSISDDTGGVKSNFQQSVSSAPSSAATTSTTTTTVYIQSQSFTDGTENKEGEKEKEAISKTPKDSAIDLGVIALIDRCMEKNTTTAKLQEAINDHSDRSIDNTLVDSTLSPDKLKALSSPPPTPTSNLSPTRSEIGSKTKKKVSTWSPRRIFQSSDNTDASLKKKKSSGSISEEKTKHFNISALFSRSLSSSATTTTTTTSCKKTTDSKGKKTTSRSVLLSSTPSTNNLSKGTIPSASNAPKKDNQISSYNHTRLPIHTERAIYRLSHLKLSNPRRPLCDQVTISNLMFWYLSIISQQNSSIENEFSSTSLLADATGANTIGFIDKENKAMAKKVSRIKLQQQHQPRSRGSSKNHISNNNSSRRIRNHQIGPAATYSNAMDTLKQQQRLPPHVTRRNHRNISRTRSSNSSSEEEDDDEEEAFSDDEISDDGSFNTNSTREDDEGIMTDLFFGNKKRKKNSKKYSLFNITKKKNANNNNNNSNSWLPSFASPKQHNVIIPHQDEDDIPLAMYQKGKS